VGEGEDVVGVPGGVGVVLVDVEVCFVVQETVQDVGRVADADVHELGVERGVLVGDVGVDRRNRP
jgi:hypothetical protein